MSVADQDEPRPGEIRKNWSLLLAAAVGVGLSVAAIPPFVISVFAGPMTGEFGWSLQSYQTGGLFIALGILIASPLSGSLVDRFDPRRMALTGLVAFPLGISCLAMVNGNVWTFYLAMLVVTLAAVGVLPVVWTRIINGVFRRQRGLALGLMLSGSGLTGIFLPGLAQALIDAFGWRGAWLGLAALPVLVGLPICYWLLRPAAEPVAASDMPAQFDPLAGVALGSAVRGWRFWAMFSSFALVSACLAGWNANLVPILTDRAFTAQQAAALVGILGASQASGRIFAGFLADRYWAPGVAACAFLMPALGVQLVLADEVTALTAGIAIAAFGLAHGAEFDFLAYLIARYFGLRHYGKIYGLLVVPVSVATAFGAIAIGRTRDQTGSFDAALAWIPVLLVAAAGLQLSLGRYPPAAAASSPTT
jgi:MFS family permease